jgi:hypothetical protein
MRSLRGQLEALRKRLAADEKGKAVADAADAIVNKIAPAEEELIETRARSSQDMCNYPTRLNSKLAYLANVVDGADSAPTEQSRQIFTEFKERAEKALGMWREITERDVVALNALMSQNGVPAVGLGPATPQAGGSPGAN